MSQEQPAAEIVTVDYEEFCRQRQEPGVAIVDVLPTQAFERSHIPSALSLPVADIAERAAEVLPDKSQEIIVYCGSFT